MALNAIIYKAALQIADMDRRHYQDHALTLARHPSETDERMMVRLLAFACHAHDALLFGRGVGTEDEPALWQKDMTGAIDLWIEVGQPDEKSLRQACGRAKAVVVYVYGARNADVWREKNASLCTRLANLTVMHVPSEGSRALAQLAQPSMRLQWTIQERQVWISDGTRNVHLELQPWITSTVPFPH